MSLIRWRSEGPELGGLQHRMNDLFESFFREGGSMAERAGDWAPALDMKETPETLVVEVDVPGIDPAQVEVSVVGDTLTLKGHKQEERERKSDACRWTERRFGSFYRAMTLPVPVRADDVTAAAKDGVLTITLPKSVAAQPRKVDVKAS